MKIRSIQIEIIQSKIEHANAEVKVTRCERFDEISIRKKVAQSLSDAQKNNRKSLLFSDLGSKGANFPLVGAAKIMVQEIMNHVRGNDSVTLQKVVFCLEEEQTFKVFDRTIRGYIKYFQEDLGLGPYVTVDIIIELKDGIILIERSNPPYGWALPGGFLNYGESLETAACREAKEETNLDLEHLQQLHTYSELGRDARFQTITTVFVAKGKGTPQFGDDAQDLKIVPYKDLLKLEYAFDHKQVISDYLQSKVKQ